MANPKFDAMRKRMSDSMREPGAKRDAQEALGKKQHELDEKMQWASPYGASLSPGAMSEKQWSSDTPQWGGGTPHSPDLPIRSDEIQADTFLPVAMAGGAIGKMAGQKLSSMAEGAIAKHMAGSAMRRVIKDLPETGAVSMEKRLVGSGVPVGPRTSPDPVNPDVKFFNELDSQMMHNGMPTMGKPTAFPGPPRPSSEVPLHDPLPPPGPDVPPEKLMQEALVRKAVKDAGRGSRVQAWLGLDESPSAMPDLPPLDGPLPPKGGPAPWTKDSAAPGYDGIEDPDKILDFSLGHEFTGKQAAPVYMSRKAIQDDLAGYPATRTNGLPWTESAIVEDSGRMGRGFSSKKLADSVDDLDVLAQQGKATPHELEMRWKYGEGRDPSRMEMRSRMKILQEMNDKMKEEEALRRANAANNDLIKTR